MITVEIDEDVALDMLMDRLEYWTTDPTTTELFEQMYRGYLEEGVVGEGNFDVMNIVDNDYINWCTIVEEGDDSYDECKEAWESGEHELENGSYVEAEANGAYLVRG